MTQNSAVEVAEATIAIAGHLDDELEEALGDRRLSRPSFLVLDALERADGHALGQRALTDRVRRTSGSLSVRLGRLERAGLVARRPDPDNRRSQIVTLTDRGSALLRAARPDYEQRCERLVAALPGGTDGAAAAGLRDWLHFFEPGESTAPRLGVAVASAAVARRMRAAVGLPEASGVLIVRAAPGGAGETAGLRRGDLVRTVDGAAVESLGDLDRAVHAADGVIRLGVLRGVEEREVTVRLVG
ncbi:MAG TPA: MarR family transcriptional regulator [Solirubrobacteraceae bacterium]|nr:MarR family transcriptional regulator [Solirubrobacteraceae bacterium]